jgi:hypothetical protein
MTLPHRLLLVQAILFLAPLAFNLTLEEDPRVNRLVRQIIICSAPPNAHTSDISNRKTA